MERSPGFECALHIARHSSPPPLVHVIISVVANHAPSVPILARFLCGSMSINLAFQLNDKTLKSSYKFDIEARVRRKSSDLCNARHRRQRRREVRRESPREVRQCCDVAVTCFSCSRGPMLCVALVLRCRMCIDHKNGMLSVFVVSTFAEQ